MKPSDVALTMQTPTKRQITQTVVLELLRAHGPLTDEQVVEHYGRLLQTRSELKRRSPSAIRGARHQLVHRQLVRDTGGTRETAFDVPATVWALVES